MKILYSLFLLCGFVLPAYSQTPDVQVDRRIYLWDVTLSMQGYAGRTPDIWDDVAKWISDDIQEISDENTELIILPFQTHILAEWHAKADKSGKAELLKHIVEAKKLFKDTTTTNIAGPFSDVMNKHVDNKRSNIVFLLTDGQQSNIHGGQAAWLDLLGHWHDFAKGNNAFLVYLMLTPEAKDDKIIESVNPSTGIVVEPENANIKIMDIEPQEKVDLNVTDYTDQVTLRISFASRKAGLPMPEGIRISVKTEKDAFVPIDEEAAIVNKVISIPLKYNSKELRDLMGEKEIINVPLTLKLINHDEILHADQINLSLIRSNIDLVLINKIQKKLTITLKR